MVATHGDRLRLIAGWICLAVVGCDRRQDLGSGSKGGVALECTFGLELCEGRCIDPSSDPKHCGGCSRPACAPGQFCGPSACDPLRGCGPSVCKDSCGIDEGWTDCGGACVSLDVNSAHCGRCGRSCPVGEFCSLGGCQACPAEQSYCAWQFLEPHSGACFGDLPSSREPYCSFGCAAGLEACDVDNDGFVDDCFDLLSDPAHCGGCTGVVCSAGQVCGPAACDSATGRCGLTVCLDACPGTLMNCQGACVEILTNSAHCGRCGNRCSVREHCEGGVCTSCVYGQDFCLSGVPGGHSGRCLSPEERAVSQCPGGVCIGSDCI